MSPLRPPTAAGTVSLPGAGGHAVDGRWEAGEWHWTWAGSRARYRSDRGGRAVLDLDVGTSTPEAAAAGLRAVVEHAFTTDGIESFGWQAPLDDLTARRAVWSCGFTIDGVWRGQAAGSAGIADLVVGSLLSTEPLEPAHPWWVPAVLTGDRVRLRPWLADDEPDGAADPAAERFTGTMAPRPDTYREWWIGQRDRMARGQAVFWCLADRDTDLPLGGLQLTGLDDRRTAGSGWLGYFLFPRSRGLGLLGEAIDLLVPHAFSARADDAGSTGIGLHRLTAGTDIANRASQRVLRRSGFRQVADERFVLAQPDGPPAGALTFELLAIDDMVAQSVEPGETPELTAAGLRLRAWTPHDAPTGGPLPDPAARRYLPAAAIPTAATFTGWLHQRNIDTDRGVAVTWCVAAADDDRPLGSIAVFGIDDGAPGNAELGYWLYPPARSKGWMTAALPLVIDYAFATSASGGLGLHRLHAVTDAENTVSRRLLERAGFRRWGLEHRSSARRDGSLADLVHYELLVPDP